jgi:hypothetical protein
MDSNSELEYESDSDSDSEYDLEYSESLLSKNEEPPDSSSQLLPSELPPPELSSSEPLPSEPSSSRTSTPYERHSIGARIQAITFLELGIPHWEIKAKTKISKSQLYKLRNKAINRGWDPKVSGIVEVHHVEDAPRSGRPKVSQNVVDLILKTVTQNSTTRGWSCSQIAYEVSLALKESQAAESTVSEVTV